MNSYNRDRRMRLCFYKSFVSQSTQSKPRMKAVENLSVAMKCEDVKQHHHRFNVLEAIGI